VDVQIHASLTLSLDDGDCLTSRYCRLTPYESAIGNRSIGGWLGHTAGEETPHLSSVSFELLTGKCTDW